MVPSRAVRSDPRLGYALAVLGVALVVIVRSALNPVLGDRAPYIPFVLPVLAAGWYGGARPALVASALGVLACAYFFVPPHLSLKIPAIPERINLGVLSMVCVALSLVFERLHAARRRSDEHGARLEREVLDRRSAAAEIERLNRQLAEQVQELESLLQILPVGVLTADPSCERITGNPAAYAMLGMPPGANVSLSDPAVRAGTSRLPYRLWVNGRAVPVEDLTMQRAARTGRPVLADEQHFEFDDGRSVTLQASAVPLLDGDRRVRKVIGAWVDVTASRNAATALQRSAERSRLLWQATALLLSAGAPQVVLRRVFETIAPHLQLDVFFNYVADENGGLRLESCAGVDDAVIPHLRHLAPGQAVCGTVALRREPVAAFHIHQSSDPMLALVRSSGLRAYVCHPLMIGEHLQGTLSFGSRTRETFEPDEVEFLRTVCGHVAVAYERDALVRRLQAEDRGKDEFLAMLSHELRNPLAPIRHAAQVLRTHGEDRAVRWAGAVITRQVEHLVRLLEDLLDTSRIAHGKLVLRREPVEVATVLAAAVESSRPLLEAGRHTLALEVPEQALRVDADPVRLAQVFTNLLNNAARYTNTGGHIGVSVARCGTAVEIRVRDDGIGMDAATLARVFDPFAQGPGAADRSPGGLGLGLALVRSLVELHGGSIAAHSDGPGSGSTFTIRLPLCVHDGVSEHPAGAPAAADGIRRRALVVDDLRDGADGLALMLELAGHEVHVAYDGESALALADRLEPDLVLLDLGLPGIGGLDVCRRMRGQPWARHTTFVAVTGWGREEDRRRTAEAGFAHHLVKPVEFAAVERLLAADPVGQRN